jgi:predicted ATPase
LINEIHIRNFRCYQDIRIRGCADVNVLVGDNGSGKTALLEAVFLALGASPEISIRYRVQRGLENNFTGAPRVIEGALWQDMFYGADLSRIISIDLKATGPDNRSVQIAHNTTASAVLPLKRNAATQIMTGANTPPVTGGVRFEWKDAAGNRRAQVATVTPQGVRLTGEEGVAPDFFFLSANGTIPAQESAAMFSALSLKGEKQAVLSAFQAEYPWIGDISVEVYGGAPILFATVKGAASPRPLVYVSGGINKILYVMLCIASSTGGVVLLDEVENGLYYKHRPAIWRMLLSMARRFKTQLLLTTHSYEWLEALAEAEPNPEEISVWRLERGDAPQPEIKQFSGKQVFAAIGAGGEIR